LREEQLVGPLQVTVDARDLDGIAARKPIDEALILVGVAASGRDELRRHPLVLAPERVIEPLVKTPLRCHGVVQQHELDVSSGQASAHLSKFIEGNYSAASGRVTGVAS